MTRRTNVARIAGLAGMAAAAASLAVSVGAGTAAADTSSSGGAGASGSSANSPKSAPAPGGGAAGSTGSSSASASSASRTAASSTLAAPSVGALGPIYNPGPFTFGEVTNPTLPAGSQYFGQFIVKPAVPGKQPWLAVTGFQLPFWTVNPTTGAPVPPF
jgi:hypothetical protein